LGKVCGGAVIERLWEMADIVDVLEARETAVND
jgi:hypothetical protein